MTFNKKDIPVYKRALSFVAPVWIRNEKSTTNMHLEVLLYKDRFQLATHDALYSDGIYYTPALAIVKVLKSYLPHIKNVLVCGVGLGSIVEILLDKNINPNFTLVEYDAAILRLATEYLTSNYEVQLNPVCSDAKLYLATQTDKFDFIFIDIFESQIVPDFVTQEEFLNNCKLALNNGGRLAMNYIISDEIVFNDVCNRFAKVFPKHKVVTDNINKIFIASV